MVLPVHISRRKAIVSSSVTPNKPQLSDTSAIKRSKWISCHKFCFDFFTVDNDSKSRLLEIAGQSTWILSLRSTDAHDLVRARYLSCPKIHCFLSACHKSLDAMSCLHNPAR